MKKLRTMMFIAAEIALVTAGVTVPAGTSSAWVDAQCKFTTPILKWKDSTTRYGYSVPAGRAAAAWDATPTPISLTLVGSGANIEVSDGNYGSTVIDSFTHAVCNGAGYEIETAQIAVNRYYTDSYSEAKRQSPIAHEFGHALGLDHSSARSCTNMPVLQPLTSDRYDICLINTPRADDINGMNALY